MERCGHGQYGRHARHHDSSRTRGRVSRSTGADRRHHTKEQGDHEGTGVVDDASGVALLEGLVSGERLAALVDGAPLSAEELPLWQRAAAEHILASIGELDWDTYSMWAVHRVRHSDSREAYLADVGGGYSFDGAWREYRGGATTHAEALALLRRHGYISVDDFRNRRPKTSSDRSSATGGNIERANAHHIARASGRVHNPGDDSLRREVQASAPMTNDRHVGIRGREAEVNR